MNSDVPNFRMKLNKYQPSESWLLSPFYPLSPYYPRVGGRERREGDKVEEREKLRGEDPGKAEELQT